MGLSVSFLMLASIVAWMMAYPGKVADWAKSVMILVILWYGLVVHYTPSKMMGWPCTGDPPEIGVVLSWKIIDPARDPRNAGIYVWMVPKKEKKEYVGILKSLIPIRIFSPKSESLPRAYKFPYSLEEALRISEEGGKLKEGDILYFKKGRGDRRGDSDRDSDDERQYELVEFEKVFDKTNE